MHSYKLKHKNPKLSAEAWTLQNYRASAITIYVNENDNMVK